jgi:hypothetical protein
MEPKNSRLKKVVTGTLCPEKTWKTPSEDHRGQAATLEKVLVSPYP